MTVSRREPVYRYSIEYVIPFFGMSYTVPFYWSKRDWVRKLLKRFEIKTRWRSGTRIFTTPYENKNTGQYSLIYTPHEDDVGVIDFVLGEKVNHD